MYFGADRELFGVYHPPASAATNSVLLCPPLGQDQIRSHRLYRQLANALVAEGIAVLRFDYYGSGDSAGDSMQVDCDRCIADIVVAANQLRTLSAVDRIVAFGARLGGSLALAAADAARFAELVVWDPVLDGAAHVARLDAQQNALRLDAKRFTKPRSAADVAGQWLGFEFSAPLRRQFAVASAFRHAQHESAVFTVYRNAAVARDIADNRISRRRVAAFGDAGHQVAHAADGDAGC